MSPSRPASMPPAGARSSILRKSRSSATPRCCMCSGWGGGAQGLLSLEAPKLVWFRVAAGPALQRRAACRRAVANVQAEAAGPDEFRKGALLLDLPDLIGSAIARP